MNVTEEVKFCENSKETLGGVGEGVGGPFVGSGWM